MIRIALGVIIPAIVLAALLGVNPWVILGPVAVVGGLAYVAHISGALRGRR